jgi:hypothetical protein
MVDVTSTLVTKAQVALKSIAGPDAIVNKDQWNMIQMKDEYHTRFIAILQIIY